MRNTVMENIFDELFSDYYSYRRDAIDLSNDQCVPYWDKYQLVQKMLHRSHTAPTIP